jgi:hypothetical protein
MPMAFTYDRLTWTLSPMALQVPGVILGSPFAHGIGGNHHEDVCNITPSKPWPPITWATNPIWHIYSYFSIN